MNLENRGVWDAGEWWAFIPGGERGSAVPGLFAGVSTGGCELLVLRPKKRRVPWGDPACARV